ncbi:D-alanyl-lipoteichoic acid biosynthesis protein DltD [Weissella ceti]|uniref:Protein DltD n=1 Tax=Weissella ceti TaxID=759620 RepID=A0ABT3E3C4_9LACO|nr:D-alanyl-lipoteichoic acid biosynthesis protein DltD [Weissella ceti]MCW0952898.1 D-alanyl-lipoteichoic acid biosynthesis protein DltD [Weissella ceti]QVK11445.1 D-alanyl-lipoteichoic acid biosynthesis protein DltD [Weissella ceti]
MLKRLWLMFGPVLLAVLGVITLVFLVDVSPKMDYTAQKKTATSVDPKVFKSATLKQELLGNTEHRFVPFFGSSEWKRFDPFHPSVLAEKYDRDYRPLLLGQAGATSLSQYFGMQQISDQMTNKQAVFVISPQWFAKRGTSKGAFGEFYSPSQALYFLKNATTDASDQYAATRFLAMIPDGKMTKLMTKVSEGKSLNQADHDWIDWQLQIQMKEDKFFSAWRLNADYKKDVEKNLSTLPNKFDLQTLTEIATKAGEENTTNNQFGIQNKFFAERLGHGNKLAKLKNSQTHFNYCRSSEYSDFQLVLEQLAKTKTDVLFIIPPVNKKWSDYTGLNVDRYNSAVEKIKTQLTTQGFNNITDLSKDGGKPYFLQDTIHVGWNGWLAIDDAVKPFLSQPSKPVEYKIDNQFLSEAWDNYLPYEQDITDVIK